MADGNCFITKGPRREIAGAPGRMTSARVEAFYASLPQRYVGSGVLITDEADAILMVEPAHKSTW